MGADGTAHGGAGVYIPMVRMTDEAGGVINNVLDNVSIVKNVSMDCANRGSIADIRRVDILRNNLKQYEKSTDLQNGSNYSMFSPSFSVGSQVNSIFRDIRKEGSGLSKNIVAPLKIPLQDLVGFGKVQQYNAAGYGKTRVHMELNLDRLNLSQYLGDDTGAAWARGAARNTFQNLTKDEGAALDTLFYAFPLRHIEDSPFWVGQKISISATAGGGRAGGNIANEVRMITSILYRAGPVAGTEAQLELTLDSVIDGGGALTGTETYTGITCIGDTANFTFSCNTADLVLTRVMNPKKAADKLTYTEFSTEEHNANGVTNFQRQFICEPESINLYIFRADSLLSKNAAATDIQNYRLRINNVDATNRSVVVASPLYIDLINRTFLNSGRSLKNTNEQAQSNAAYKDTEAGYYNSAGDALVLICNPLPFGKVEKMVQVNINAGGANINKICLYKELVKQI